MLTNAEIGKVMRKAHERKIFSGAQVMLNAILCTANSKGECRKSNQEFANYLGVSDRSISGWIAELRKHNMIGLCINSHSHCRIIYVRGLGKYQNPETFNDYSPAQKMFHEAFPDKIIDCEVPDTVDMEALIAEMKKSIWLKASTGMTLKSYAIKHYKRIMRGVFRDDVYLARTGHKPSTERVYTKEEMNSLFQKVEEIEI